MPEPPASSVAVPVTDPVQPAALNTPVDVTAAVGFVTSTLYVATAAVHAAFETVALQVCAAVVVTSFQNGSTCIVPTVPAAVVSEQLLPGTEIVAAATPPTTSSFACVVAAVVALAVVELPVAPTVLSTGDVFRTPCTIRIVAAFRATAVFGPVTVTPAPSASACDTEACRTATWRPVALFDSMSCVYVFGVPPLSVALKFPAELALTPATMISELD